MRPGGIDTHVVHPSTRIRSSPCAALARRDLRARRASSHNRVANLTPRTHFVRVSMHESLSFICFCSPTADHMAYGRFFFFFFLSRFHYCLFSFFIRLSFIFFLAPCTLLASFLASISFMSI